MRNLAVIMADNDAHQHPRHMMYAKMENLIRCMQFSENAIPVRSQKLFLTTVPDAFAGQDLIDWLYTKLQTEERLHASHLANLLCQYGYLFPVSDQKNLVVKDDNTLFRFQTPYFWPSNNWKPDHVDYAIYLAKRTLRNKQRHGLEDFEQVAFNKLQKMLAHKWDFIFMQAEEQFKQSKERKKADKIIVDSQEKAFWRVQRPPPGQTRCLDEAVTRHIKPTLKKKTVETCQREIAFLQRSQKRPRLKISKAAESILLFSEQYYSHDPFLSAVPPSNPWLSDDTLWWELNTPLVDTPSELRIRRWGFSLEELLKDPTGIAEFEEFLKKEFSQENLHFWLACEEIKYLPKSLVTERVQAIYSAFLAPGAPHEVNVDGKTYELTQKAIENPDRFTFDAAQSHIFLLMKKDSYQRYMRSEDYRNLLETAALQPNARKGRFFNFGSTKSKKSPQPSPGYVRRRGSEISDSSTSDAAPVLGVKGHHSYSTGNLQSLHQASLRGDLSKKRSSVDSKRTTSGTVLPKRIEKLDLCNSPSGGGGGQTSKDTLEVPSAHGSSEESEENPCMALAVPSKMNVVAPWETA
ncbi:regulator of G-protein signaling 7 isoform X2 [Lingula anatina]|uniref:Regulator of G-protein signaling 7 isoform X2 n=1 Tax=Lingula anatina TaxID=7574 RepID=A0A1S3I160_LINAN|nr:regulator of G-protein signaling 7 isoform X2 [Lingula anatina]|eukprot:XP_013391566.1 regulator of G-protein signaling 7 isoform X2 [Lingula anatina]